MAQKMKDGLPPVVPVVAAKVLQLQKELEESTFFPFYGLSVVGDVFIGLVEEVKQTALPAGDIGVFTQTCLNLAGKDFTRVLGADLAWRVAGNLPRIKGNAKKGILPLPVPPWTGQADREWVLAEILRVEGSQRRFKPKDASQAPGADGFVKRSGVELTFRLMSGLPAGRVVKKFWSYERVDMSKVDLGFDRFNRARYSNNFVGVSHTYQDAAELCGMRLQVLVEPAKCTPDTVAFDEIYGTASTLAWNRRLTEMRARHEFKCPKGYPDEFDCYRCPVGRDSCSAACRPTSLNQAPCAGCNNRHAWFDVAVSNQECLGCLARHR